MNIPYKLECYTVFSDSILHVEKVLLSVQGYECKLFNVRFLHGSVNVKDIYRKIKSLSESTGEDGLKVLSRLEEIEKVYNINQYILFVDAIKCKDSTEDFEILLFISKLYPKHIVVLNMQS